MIFMHVPAEVWQKLFTHVSGAAQSDAVVHAMLPQPLVCDHTGPDEIGVPQV